MGLNGIKHWLKQRKNNSLGHQQLSITSVTISMVVNLTYHIYTQADTHAFLNDCKELPRDVKIIDLCEWFVA